MLASLASVLRHWLTGRDNSTYDLFRALSLVCIVVGLALEVYAVVWGVAFDLQAYGVGVGVLLLAAGGALKLKAETEPDPPP